MQKKQQVISPIKINRDLTPTKFPSDAAFNITNMKVIANEELSTLSIETEQVLNGKKVFLKYSDNIDLYKTYSFK